MRITDAVPARVDCRAFAGAGPDRRSDCPSAPVCAEASLPPSLAARRAPSALRLGEGSARTLGKPVVVPAGGDVAVLRDPLSVAPAIRFRQGVWHEIPKQGKRVRRAHDLEVQVRLKGRT